MGKIGAGKKIRILLRTNLVWNPNLSIPTQSPPTALIPSPPSILIRFHSQLQASLFVINHNNTHQPNSRLLFMDTKHLIAYTTYMYIYLYTRKHT